MEKGDIMSIKDKLLDELLRREGSYVNDSADSGGETNYGITINVARRYGYTGSMRALSKALAKDIYIDRYWHKLSLDKILKVAPKAAEELFDTGVNMGISRAGRFLQRSLNVFNPKAKLVVDGAIGQKTINSLNTFIKKRGAEGDSILLKALDSLQGNFYIELAERRIKDKRFVFGWFRNRIR